MTKSTTKKAATAEPSTTELLAALNADNEAAAATESAPAPAPADTLTLAAGTMKFTIMLPGRVAECRARGKLIPVHLVYVIGEDGSLSHHYAYDIHCAALDTVINPACTRPGFIPDRLPGTSGANPEDFMSEHPLSFWRQSRGEMTLFLKERAVEPLVVPKVTTPKPAQPIGYAELPAIPHHEYSNTPGIEAFIESAQDFIVAAHSERKFARAVGAAHALVKVAQNLAGVDQVPPAKPRERGHEATDPYPTGASAIVRASNDAQLPTPELTTGFRAALKLLGSRATDRNHRTACENGGEFLIELRDHLRNVAA